MSVTNKKRVAKNTLALYIRMIFVMGITLFSSRIVLEKLGVTDFGVYSSVGGVVAMLGFLNGTLSAATSRFITFELGKGNTSRLKETFSTAFYTHLILAVFVVLILILGGTWFVLNKLLIPEELKMPALWTFYISTFSTLISITQVPYTSMIIANEKMNIYAYLGIIEAAGKLGVAYAISLAPIERLVWYALLMAFLQLIVAMSYRLYCIRNYIESRVSRLFNKKIFKEMLQFSGWSLIANISQILSTQGLVVLINMFFAPAIAAAQAVGNQISNALTQFSTNFLTAINPQVIKLYSVGEKEASRQLNLQATVLVWDLMLLIGLPLIVCMNPIIHLWLVDVPPYAVIFAQYIVLSQILNTFSNTFYIPMIASGELKDNSIAALFFGILEFVLLYFLLRAGLDVMWVQYMTVLQALIFSLVVKPFILCWKIGYKAKELIRCYAQCLKSAVIPVVTCLLILRFVNVNYNFSYAFGAGIIIILTVLMSSFVCLNKPERQKIYQLIKSKINK